MLLIYIRYRFLVFWLCPLDKPDQCEYLLLWTTEAACPIRHQPVKDECAIVDRLTGDLFNISHMRADTFYRKGDYEFNICGPIRNSTNCLGENISVCRVTTDQTGRTKGVPLTGATGYQLDFVGVGSLRLSYMGEITSGRTTRVEIELVCTTALLPKNSVIEARGSLGDDQVHRINFYSSGVCPNYRTDPVSIYNMCQFFLDVVFWGIITYSPRKLRLFCKSILCCYCLLLSAFHGCWATCIAAVYTGYVTPLLIAAPS